MRTLCSTSALLLMLAPVLSAQGAGPEPALKWGPAPAIFPKGAQMAVVSGDPGKSGQFVVELSFPNGYKIPPHFHPTDEMVQVKQGTFLVGMGDKLDAKKTMPMAVGDTGTVPAKAHHYAVAKGATIVSVTAMGPFAMTYVNPKDDPTAAPPSSSGY